jgi:hypothetical protein
VLGLALATALSFRNIGIGYLELNVGTLMMASIMAIVGFQLVAFAFYTKLFAIAEGLLPEDSKFTSIFHFFTLERGIVIGLMILLAGLALLAHALWIWQQARFGQLPSIEENLRRIIPAATLLMLGFQSVFSSFFMSVLGLKTLKRKPPNPHPADTL